MRGRVFALAQEWVQGTPTKRIRMPVRTRRAHLKGRVPQTSVSRIETDGVLVFYREAGPVDAPVVLLLHGFPTSSFMYRDLIPRLADDYRVIAPDLPGFGFTDVPAARQYRYSFECLARTVIAFTDA